MCSKVSQCCTISTYIHFGRSTSAARNAAFTPTYAAAPKAIRNSGLIQPRFGMARFFINNLMFLSDEQKQNANHYLN